MLRCQGPDEPNSFVTKLVITTPALRGKVVFIIFSVGRTAAAADLQRSLLQGFADKRALFTNKLMS